MLIRRFGRSERLVAEVCADGDKGVGGRHGRARSPYSPISATGSSTSTIASIRRRPALFALIDERMGAYIQRLLACEPDEAYRVQKEHFHTHGTTLAGLMKRPRRRSARLPRRRPRHPARPDRPRRPARPRRWPGCRAASSSSPTATRLMPAACSTRSGSTSISTISTTFTPASYRPKPDPHGYATAVRAVRDRSGARADGRRHGAEPEAREDARNDHGVGRQWLRTRQSRLDDPASSTIASPTSANGSKRSWRTME